jgi:hypothetical protein
MIRSGAGEGGEGRVGESQVPVLVKQSPIESSEDGGVSFVRPRVTAIKQGKLKQGQGPDGVVKGRSKREVEIVVVFVARIAHKVKVTNDEPGDREERAEGLQLREKCRRQGVVSRRVDVSDDQG